MRFLLLLLFFVPFVSSVSVSVDCPESVVLNAEFSCDFSFSGLSGVYDLKVELKDGSSTVARIWDPSRGEWRSSYYYLSEFVSGDGSYDVRLMLTSEGSFDGVVKLRQGSVENVGSFSIGTAESEVQEETVEEEVIVRERFEKDLSVKEAVPKGNEPIVLGEIVLGESATEKTSSLTAEKVLVYESRDAVIGRFAPYAFSVFLLLVILVLLIQR